MGFHSWFGEVIIQEIQNLEVQQVSANKKIPVKETRGASEWLLCISRRFWLHTGCGTSTRIQGCQNSRGTWITLPWIWQTLWFFYQLSRYSCIIGFCRLCLTILLPCQVHVFLVSICQMLRFSNGYLHNPLLFNLKCEILEYHNLRMQWI